MQPATQTDGHVGALAVAVLGADAVLAGLPATPVQLAHACLRSGFDLAVPASWGDELVAAECLRALAARTTRPAVMCACPLARRELLAVGADLASMIVPLVPPPVAAARYLRALFGDRGVQITYIGACPGADHPDVHQHILPAAFLSDLAARGLDPAAEPTVFDSVIPPDRRRFFSLPGGVPAPEQLWRSADARTLVELDRGHLPIDLAQQLLSHDCALVDIAPALGCPCSGVTGDIPAAQARAAVTALEPPRAAATVVDSNVEVELADPICADALGSAPPAPGPQHLGVAAPEGPPVSDRQIAPRDTRRRSPASGVRAIRGMVPLARVAAGGALPRAYVAARRRQPADEPDGAVAAPSGRHPRSRAEAVPSGRGENGRSRSKSRTGSRATPDARHPPAVAGAPHGPPTLGDGPGS